MVFLFEAHCVLCKVLNETSYSGTVTPCRTRQLLTGRSGASRTECTVRMVNYIYGNLVEIQTPTYWSSIGRSMTAPPPLLSPSSVLQPSSHCVFVPARKTATRVKKKYCYLIFIFYCASLKSRTFNCVSCVASVRS
jgi:hypothetical protein